MLRKFQDGDTYLRAEHFLRDGLYDAATYEIRQVVYGCPIQRRLKSCEGLGLEFVGVEKILGLGITNESLVRVCTGQSNPEKWAGHKLQLEVRMVRAQKKGTTQPAIRIMPKAGTIMRAGLIKELGESLPRPSDKQELAKTEAPKLTDDEQAYVTECSQWIADVLTLESLGPIAEAIGKKSDAVKGVLRPIYAARKAELTPETPQ